MHIGSIGLAEQQSNYERNAVREVQPTSVLSQFRASGNGMSAEDAETRQVYGHMILGQSGNGMSPSTYRQRSKVEDSLE